MKFFDLKHRFKLSSVTNSLIGHFNGHLISDLLHSKRARFESHLNRSEIKIKCRLTCQLELPATPPNSWKFCQIWQSKAVRNRSIGSFVSLTINKGRKWSLKGITRCITNCLEWQTAKRSEWFTPWRPISGRSNFGNCGIYSRLVGILDHLGTCSGHFKSINSFGISQ